ncbi:M15 family metallopeptidase, partial [Candidatus Woesearchaeota archaeon]|nr:M15 family metallopeptidase [Candidatus Woesearchaeota archaeon]
FDALISPDSPPQFYGRFEEIPYTTATNPPASQYKVFYHIYAGKDLPAYYQVYLRGTGGSFYQDTAFRRPVASGFIKTGDFKSETIDFTAPTGYKELCIVVNNQEQCGFKQVTTDFGVNYLSEQYLKQQASQTDIKSEAECVSGNPSAFNFLNPNVQAGVENTLNPAIYNRGITRVCSTDNPGKTSDPAIGTESQRWRDVGNCGSANLKCWLDTDSVKNVIRNSNIENQTLAAVGVGDLEKQYVDALTKEGKYLADFDSFKKELEGLRDSEIISKINENIGKVYRNNQKGYLYLKRGNAHGNQARATYRTFLDTQKKPETPATGALDCKKFEDTDGDGIITNIDCGYLTGTSADECFACVKQPTGTGELFPDEKPTEETKTEQIRRVEERKAPSQYFKFPIFEFEDGTRTSNLFYKFSGKSWFWSEEGESGSVWIKVEETIPSKISQRDKKFIESLRKDKFYTAYSTGLIKLVDRTLADSEGGYIPFFNNPELVTENVNFDSDKRFKIQIPRPTRAGTSVDVTYWFEFDSTNSRWKWSFNEEHWMNVPETVIKGSGLVSFEGTEPVPEMVALIKSLNGKNFDEGAEIIFDIDSTDEGPRELVESSSSSTEPTTTEETCTDIQSCQKLLGEKIIELASKKKQERTSPDYSAVQADTEAKSFECLALQVAMVESGLRHCKLSFDASGNIISPKNGNPLYCDNIPGSVLGGDVDAGGSFGVMQINSGHTDAFPDAYNFESNVNYGLDLLIENYNSKPLEYECYRTQAQGIYLSEPDPVTEEFSKTSYFGWKRAIRYYNGWNSEPKCWCYYADDKNKKCTTDNTGKRRARGNPWYVDSVTVEAKTEIARLFPEVCGETKEVSVSVSPVTYSKAELMGRSSTIRGLTSETIKAFFSMKAAAETDGFILNAVSGYRTFNTQLDIWNNKFASFSGTDQEKAKKTAEFSAVPGMSRHHWGTEIDINSVDPSYWQNNVALYGWLVSNAPTYGFCQSYDKDRGVVKTEKWHWSYKPISKQLTQQYSDTIIAQDITGLDIAGETTIVSNFDFYKRGSISDINPDCLF